MKNLYGKPLIGYIIETALNVKEIDRVIVSTEDIEIADVSKKYGAEVPFIRPEELSEDATPTFPVLMHAYNYLEQEEGYKADIIILLYATSPLLKSNSIKEAIELLQEKDYDSILSVVEDRGHFWIDNDDQYVRLYPKVLKNRQFVKPLYRENGAIYLCKKEQFLKEKKMTCGNIGIYIMDDKESVDIDEMLDFKICESLMKAENEK